MRYSELEVNVEKFLKCETLQMDFFEVIASRKNLQPAINKHNWKQGINTKEPQLFREFINYFIFDIQDIPFYL